MGPMLVGRTGIVARSLVVDVEVEVTGISVVEVGVGVGLGLGLGVVVVVVIICCEEEVIVEVTTWVVENWEIVVIMVTTIVRIPLNVY